MVCKTQLPSTPILCLNFLRLASNLGHDRNPFSIFSGVQSLVEVGHQQGIREEIHQILEALLLYQSLELQGNHQEIPVVVRQYLQQVPKKVSMIFNLI